MKSLAIVVLVVAVTHVVAPRVAGAQLWRTIKEQTARKAAERKAKADSAIIARAGRTVDSTLAKSWRGVDTAVSVAAGAADQAVARTEQAVANATAGLRGDDGEEDRLATDLAAGRAVLREIRFDATSDQLAAGSEVHVVRLARLLSSQPGGFLLEVHVDPSADAAADRALTVRRALLIKTQLVAAGVSAERVFVIGLGATRPASDGIASNTRVEVARLQ